MNRSTKIILIVTVTAFILGMVVWIFFGASSEGLIEDPELPREYWSRSIEIQEIEGEKKIAVNEFDGYEITVPSDWQVGEVSGPFSGLEIYSDPESVGIESFRGIFMNILTLESLDEITSLIPEYVNFEEITINGVKAFVASYDRLDFFDVDDSGNPIYEMMGNSGEIVYIMSGRKHYIVRCVVEGELNYRELLSQCAVHARTFKMIK